MDQIHKYSAWRNLSKIVGLSTFAALILAGPASAQNGVSSPRSYSGATSPATGSGLQPPRPVIRDASPPVQAPSVDTNPNAGRGQSMYPPRATEPLR